LYEQGLIQPISPVTLFEASAVRTAFRHIQQGKHIGKIVVRMPSMEKHGDAPPMARKPRELNLDAHSAYFLVGGMGGLGRAVSSWLVERGARHLIFLSRSAGQGETDQAFVKELESQGCKVQVFSGSITSRCDVLSAVDGATSPIKGVINLTMVLQVSFFELDFFSARLIRLGPLLSRHDVRRLGGRGFAKSAGNIYFT
jgi:KR domain